jgi:hypothetical protein
MDRPVKITCEGCQAEIVHVCRGKGIGAAAVELFKWRPEAGFPDALKKGNPYIAKLDAKDGEGKIDDVDSETVPFMCETYLYALMGKEDARTLMALVNNLIREAGLEPRQFQEKAWRSLQEALDEKLAEKKRREEAKVKWAQRMTPVEMRASEKKGYTICRYAGFYEFDVNVQHCEDAQCLASGKGYRFVGRHGARNGKLSAAVTDIEGNLLVECRICKRVHVATKEQIAGWRNEDQLRTSRGEEHQNSFVRSAPVRAALGLPKER